MESLGEEIHPDSSPMHASQQYRRQLVQSSVYKVSLLNGDKPMPFYIVIRFFQSILKCLEKDVSPNLKSAANRELPRGISSGSQHINPHPSQFPVTQPIEKIEAKIQTTGEAEYVGDIPTLDTDLHGAFVYVNEGPCELESIDWDPALVRMQTLKISCPSSSTMMTFFSGSRGSGDLFGPH